LMLREGGAGGATLRPPGGGGGPARPGGGLAGGGPPEPLTKLRIKVSFLRIWVWQGGESKMG